jgi:peptide-methionine (S)-S-oxide reductase
MAKATFGAGCFWGVEAAFRGKEGVLATAVGFMGGTLANPSYEDVCTGDTGHAEVVEVDYDPARISYETLLELFWQIHDPTQLNRQGPDFGTQYRSVIFFHTQAQEAAARASLAREQASGHYRRTIVTEVSPAATFWRAEEYHQQYLEKRGRGCRL